MGVGRGLAKRKFIRRTLVMNFGQRLELSDLLAEKNLKVVESTGYILLSLAVL